MAIVACLAWATSAQAGSSVTTVVSGLDNPRDLAFGPGGRLYVAEAGHGGAECITGGEEGTTCIGFTSGISSIDLDRSSAHRVVSGILSYAGEDGSAATGVDGISVLGGKLYGIIAGSSDALPPTGLTPQTAAGAKAQAGRLIKVSRWGKWKIVADVGHVNYQWSSDHQDLVPGQFPDANPYGVLAVPGALWVVDAGANTLNRVGRHGQVSVDQFIPNPPASDSVPTCIDRGPDGALYIGELTGGGNGPGAARVWRYAPWDSHPLTQWASGLTAVTGCGFGRDGRFYATEFSTAGLEAAAPGTGAVVRVPPHSAAPVTVASGLNFPGGFAAGCGSLYVSNWSIAPANAGGGPTGEVIRIGLGNQGHQRHHDHQGHHPGHH
jgi:hypothetical protein